MKLKGDNEDQISQATQIRDANLDMLAQLKTFVQEKLWAEEKGDDKERKEFKERNRAQALEAIEILNGELKSPDAAFYLEHGASQPVAYSGLLQKIARDAKKADSEAKHRAVESFETALHYFVDQNGGHFGYQKMVPQYKFEFTNAKK